MNCRILGGLVALSFLSLLSGCKEASEFQPELSQGGRLVSIVRAPNRPNEFLAAAETGGLFRSVDGGLHWTPVSGLPSFSMSDVAYAPNDPQTILVTFRTDFRVSPNNRYVWRSADGGRSWSQAQLVLPEGGNCAPAEAFGISFNPASQDVYVGTSCGVALSHDRGATWSLLSWVYPHTFGFGVNSVLAEANGRVFAIDDFGEVAMRDPSSGTWSQLTNVSGSSFGYAIHCIAVSPTDPNHIFIYGAQLQESMDGGLTWAVVPGTQLGGSREPFIVTAPKAKWGQGYELFAGNGVDLLRYRLLDTSPAPVVLSRTVVSVQHVDPSDLLYDLDGVTPKLASGDGGLQITTDSGDSWTLAGGGPWGLNALQIYEVTGQWVGTGNNPKKDLYFGTQDNNLWASSSNGAGWTKHACCEGSDFQLDRMVAQSKDAKLVFVSCGTCENRVSTALYAYAPYWNNAPPLTAGNAVDTPIRLSGGIFVQNTHSGLGFDNAFRMTTDWGDSWQPGAALLSNDIVQGRPLVVQQGAGATLYQPIQTSINWSLEQTNYGLATFAYPGFAETYPLDAGLESLAIDYSHEVPRPVLAVNPQDTNQLLAFDMGDGTVKYSKDRGETWNPDNALTTLIKQNGQYQTVTAYNGPLVTVIAWDPDAPCHILVGAKQGGIYETLNGGGEWDSVSSYSPIPSVSSFYFPPSGQIIASSYGRGLWKIDSSRTPKSCVFYPRPLPPGSGMRIINPTTGAHMHGSPDGFPDGCGDCRIIIAKNGEIGDVEVSGARLIHFALRRGQVFEFDRSGKEVPLDIPNVSPPNIDRRAIISIPGRNAEDRIKALVVNGDHLVAVVETEKELPFHPTREPKTIVTGKRALGGVIFAAPGEQVVLQGRGFAPSVAVSVSVQAQGLPPVVLSAKPDAKGTFSLVIVASGQFGQRQLITSQQDGKRLVKSAATFVVSRPDDSDSVQSFRDTDKTMR
jgi:hypothetical protein